MATTKIPSYLIFTDIDDLPTLHKLHEVDTYTLQQAAKVQTGKDIDNPFRYFFELTRRGSVLSRFQMSGFTAHVLAEFFGEWVLTEQGYSRIWMDKVHSFYLSYQFIYFVHRYDDCWVDRDLLGGDGSGDTRRRLEDSITITMQDA